MNYNSPKNIFSNKKGFFEFLSKLVVTKIILSIGGMLMRKLLFVVLVCALMFAATPFASANEFFKVDNLEFTGGVTYNTYNCITKLADDSTKDDAPDEFKNGIGFFIGADYWINDMFGIGVGFDSASTGTVKIVDSDSQVNLSGPYLKANIDLHEFFKINAGVVNYAYTQTFTKSGVTDIKGNGLGFVIGGEFTYPLMDNMLLKGNAGYRMINITSDKFAKDTSLDMGGLRLGLGISYEF